MKEMLRSTGGILRCRDRARRKLVRLMDARVGRVECAEMQQYAPPSDTKRSETHQSRGVHKHSRQFTLVQRDGASMHLSGTSCSAGSINQGLFDYIRC